MSKSKPTNTLKSGKRGGKTRTSWKPGQSGNPRGAPKRGESWAEIIKRIGDMTPIEAAEHAKAIAGKLRVIGDSLTLKEAVVVRVYAALLFEPQASLLNSFMERAEGKISENFNLQTDGKIIVRLINDEKD